MDTKLAFNIVYHPQIDGQIERIDVLSLIEFAYNNSYQTIIKMASYETFYQRKCISPFHWDEIGEKNVLAQALELEMTEKIIEDTRLIRE